MNIKEIVLNVIKKNLMIDEILDINVPLMSLENADSMTQMIIINEIQESINQVFSFEELMEIELISDLIELSTKKTNDSL
jgi:acyl carrier protein